MPVLMSMVTEQFRGTSSNPGFVENTALSPLVVIGAALPKWPPSARVMTLAHEHMKPQRVRTCRNFILRRTLQPPITRFARDSEAKVLMQGDGVQPVRFEPLSLRR